MFKQPGDVSGMFGEHLPLLGQQSFLSACFGCGGQILLRMQFRSIVIS
jgi:hypothetical protein